MTLVRIAGAASIQIQRKYVSRIHERRLSVDGISHRGGEGTPENPVVIRDSPEQPRSQPRRSSARTVRSGRSSLSSSLQSRLSTRMSPPGSPTPEGGESRNRRSSRGEGVGGLAGWLTNRFGSSA